MRRLLWAIGFLLRSKSDHEAAKQIVTLVLGTLSVEERREVVLEVLTALHRSEPHGKTQSEWKGEEILH